MDMERQIFQSDLVVLGISFQEFSSPSGRVHCHNLPTDGIKGGI